MILEPLVILDTETTGSSAAYERIIEIALVRFEEALRLAVGKRWSIPESQFLRSSLLSQASPMTW